MSVNKGAKDTMTNEHEIEIVNLKAAIFDLIQERELHLQKSNQIQEEILRMARKLEELKGAK